MANCCEPAPHFEATALVGEDFKTISLDDYKGRYLVLFFYPLDFTFVCPTEILSFSDRASEFEQLNCSVVGASVDSEYSHLAWTKTPKNKGGLGGALNIPLIADINKQVSQDYGVLMKQGFTMRGLFIIDKEGVIRHITKNDPPVGRNVDEILRLVKGYQFVDENGEVCPANWQPGQATIKPAPSDSLEFFEKVNNTN